MHTHQTSNQGRVKAWTHPYKVWATLCRNFNIGFCSREAAKCKYEHKCILCNSSGMEKKSALGKKQSLRGKASFPAAIVTQIASSRTQHSVRHNNQSKAGLQPLALPQGFLNAYTLFLSDFMLFALLFYVGNVINRFALINVKHEVHNNMNTP